MTRPRVIAATIPFGIPLALFVTISGVTAQRRPPVVDVHLHAGGADDQGPPPLGLCFQPTTLPLRDAREDWLGVFMAWQKNPPCEDPLWSPTTDRALMEETFAVLEEYNVIGVLSGPTDLVQQWREQSPNRVIPALQFRLDRESFSPDSLAQLYHHGAFEVFAEITNQYSGIEPSDMVFDPYLTVAEEMDFPVGIHIGTGPPGAPAMFPRYRARLHSPLLLEEALNRHPNLRVYIMHAGWPMLDDLLAVLWAYPQVYVGVGAISFGLPEAEFYRYLRGMVDAGFGNRVMFGSDQMVWPGMIGRAIASIEQAPFLSDQQKRDILYNNAARFLRFSDDVIAAHHGR